MSGLSMRDGNTKYTVIATTCMSTNASNAR